MFQVLWHLNDYFFPKKLLKTGGKGKVEAEREQRLRRKWRKEGDRGRRWEERGERTLIYTGKNRD